MNQITACIEATYAIEMPLSEAVISDQTTVEQLFIELQNLTVLIKTEMTSQLGIIVIFSDNDGD